MKHVAVPSSDSQLARRRPRSPRHRPPAPIASPLAAVKPPVVHAPPVAKDEPAVLDDAAAKDDKAAAKTERRRRRPGHPGRSDRRHADPPIPRRSRASRRSRSWCRRTPRRSRSTRTTRAPSGTSRARATRAPARPAPAGRRQRQWRRPWPSAAARRIEHPAARRVERQPRAADARPGGRRPRTGPRLPPLALRESDGRAPFEDFAAARHPRRARARRRGLPRGARPRLEADDRLRARGRPKRSSAQITHYTREQLEGRLVVAVANFAPQPDRGLRVRGARAGRAERRERRRLAAAGRRRRRRRGRIEDRLGDGRAARSLSAAARAPSSRTRASRRASTPNSSSPSSYQGGVSTPSAAGPHSASVRWIASR